VAAVGSTLGLVGRGAFNFTRLYCGVRPRCGEACAGEEKAFDVSVVTWTMWAHASYHQDAGGRLSQCRWHARWGLRTYSQGRCAAPANSAARARVVVVYAKAQWEILFECSCSEHVDRRMWMTMLGGPRKI
jgi:hypothetical protein